MAHEFKYEAPKTHNDLEGITCGWYVRKLATELMGDDGEWEGPFYSIADAEDHVGGDHG